MPLTIYCSKCFEPILYTLTKPILCPFCGTSLNSSNANIPKPLIAQGKQNIPINTESEIQDEPVHIRLPKKLEFEIESSNDKITLGQIGLQQKTGFSRPRPKKVNKKKELEMFRHEASKSARTNVIEITDNSRD